MCLYKLFGGKNIKSIFLTKPLIHNLVKWGLWYSGQCNIKTSGFSSGVIMKVILGKTMEFKSKGSESPLKNNNKKMELSQNERVCVHSSGCDQVSPWLYFWLPYQFSTGINWNMSNTVIVPD